jgi:hypothetical protein
MAKNTASADTDYHFESVWQTTTPQQREEVAQFWVANGAVTSLQKAADRASEVVVSMRDSTGALAAVSTAVLAVIPRLQQPLYYYRTFCAEAHRGNRTSLAMMKASQKTLLEYNLSLREPEAIGMHVEVENAMIAQQYPQAHWPQTGFRFIGYSPQGHVVRAYYFPGFILKPKPAPALR